LSLMARPIRITMARPTVGHPTCASTSFSYAFALASAS
jgi:hypothetical protein